MKPLASVIVPSYNHARYLEETLDSVLAQTYRPLEVIVVDDASTDETPTVLAAYASRVRTVRLECNSGGPARPRNVAVQLARGHYLCMFDSDDLMHPEKLARQIDFLERYPDLPLVFSDFENFRADGHTERFLQTGHEDFEQMSKVLLGAGEYRIFSPDAFDTLIADNFIGFPGVVFRRSLVDAVGGFDERLSNSDDVDFLFRVARKFDLGYLDAMLFRRRIHPGNISMRPAALRARVTVFERLRDGGNSLSARASTHLDQKLSNLYFSLGYRERVNGSRKLAVQYYFKSWSLQKRKLGIIKSLIRALLPY